MDMAGLASDRLMCHVIWQISVPFGERYKCTSKSSKI